MARTSLKRRKQKENEMKKRRSKINKAGYTTIRSDLRGPLAIVVLIATKSHKKSRISNMERRTYGWTDGPKDGRSDTPASRDGSRI